MGIVGRKENQLTGLDQILFLRTGDGQRRIQHPQQLPLRMEMGRAVFDFVDKDPYAVCLLVGNDFQFFHKYTIPYFGKVIIAKYPQ